MIELGGDTKTCAHCGGRDCALPRFLIDTGDLIGKMTAYKCKICNKLTFLETEVEEG